MEFAWAYRHQMFSILNEIANNSPFRTTSVVVASIGVSAFLYVLVAITGYLSFGNAVQGNIVSMCTFDLSHGSISRFTDTHPRSTFCQRNCSQSSYRYSCHVLLPTSSSSMQSFSRRSPEVATKETTGFARKIPAQKHTTVSTSETSRPSKA